MDWIHKEFEYSCNIDKADEYGVFLSQGLQRLAGR